MSEQELGSTAEAVQSESLLSRIRNHPGKAALIGAVAAVTTVGGFLYGRSGPDLAQHHGAPIENAGAGSASKPFTFISREKTSQTVRDTVYGGYDDLDVSGVVSPDEQDQLGLFFDFNPAGRETTQYPLPRLSEVITFNNSRLFAQEIKANPHIEPFTILNATPAPVSLRYVRFALHATKYWLNERMQQGGTIELGDHTQAKIRPDTAPHDMVITYNTPDFLKSWKSPATGGITLTAPDLTVSYIMINNAYGDRNYISQGIATEICQSLVNVEDAKTLPGGQAEEDALQAMVGGFNPIARQSLRMASQESVCNGLGVVVAASYRGSVASVTSQEADNTDKVGLQLTPWTDSKLYDSDVPAFVAAGRRIRNDSNDTFTTGSGNNLPTVRYYRTHEKL